MFQRLNPSVLKYSLTSVLSSTVDESEREVCCCAVLGTNADALAMSKETKANDCFMVANFCFLFIGDYGGRMRNSRLTAGSDETGNDHADGVQQRMTRDSITSSVLPSSLVESGIWNLSSLLSSDLVFCGSSDRSKTHHPTHHQAITPSASSIQ